MTIRHLRIFTEVCASKSVTGAAKKLYLAQPSVSLAIRELEEHYGVKLFDPRILSPCSTIWSGTCSSSTGSASA